MLKMAHVTSNILQKRLTVARSNILMEKHLGNQVTISKKVHLSEWIWRLAWIYSQVKVLVYLDVNGLEGGKLERDSRRNR